MLCTCSTWVVSILHRRDNKVCLASTSRLHKSLVGALNQNIQIMPNNSPGSLRLPVPRLWPWVILPSFTLMMLLPFVFMHTWLVCVLTRPYWSNRAAGVVLKKENHCVSQKSGKSGESQIKCVQLALYSHSSVGEQKKKQTVSGRGC